MNDNCGGCNHRDEDRKTFHIWLPGLGWNVACGEAPDWDAAALAGDGLAEDRSGRLFVNWKTLPPDRVMAIVAAHLGSGLSMERGLLVSDAAKIDIPEEWLAGMEGLSGRMSLVESAQDECGRRQEGLESSCENLAAEIRALNALSGEVREAADEAGEKARDALESAFALAGKAESLREMAQAASDGLYALDGELERHSAENNIKFGSLDKTLENVNAEIAALGALASAAANGLMSAADYVKLSGIEAGAERNPDLSGYATREEMERALAAKHGKGEAVENSMTIKGISPSLVLDSLNPNAPDDNSDWINMLLFRLLGKNLANIAIFKNDGLPSFSFRIYFNDTSKSFTMGLRNVNGAAYRTFWLDTPPADDNTGTAATTGWVRARIASATGKAATAFALAQTGPLALDLASGEACAWQDDMISPAMLEAARTAIKNATAAQIFAGFSFTVKERAYFFTYDLYDQQNIADAAILGNADRNASVFGRGSDGEMTEIELEPREARELHQYASASHKASIQRKGLALVRKMEAAQGRQELEGLLNENGLYQAYQKILAGMSGE